MFLQPIKDSVTAERACFYRGYISDPCADNVLKAEKTNTFLAVWHNKSDSYAV